MSWNWGKWPPVMERTLVDDLKWALFVFAGAIVAYLVFAGGDAWILLGCLIGLVLVVVVLNVMRFLRRRRST